MVVCLLLQSTVAVHNCNLQFAKFTKNIFNMAIKKNTQIGKTNTLTPLDNGRLSI